MKANVALERQQQSSDQPGCARWSRVTLLLGKCSRLCVQTLFWNSLVGVLVPSWPWRGLV